MFLILLHYDNGLDPVLRTVDAHNDWLDENYRAGRFLASGRRVPRTGGVILCRAMDREGLESLVRTDPFHIEGAARHEIVEFEPSKWSPLLDGLLAATPPWSASPSPNGPDPWQRHP